MNLMNFLYSLDLIMIHEIKWNSRLLNELTSEFACGVHDILLGTLKVVLVRLEL